MADLLCAWCLVSNQNASAPLKVVSPEGEVDWLLPGVGGVVKAHRRGHRLERQDGGEIPVDALTMLNGTALCEAHIDAAWQTMGGLR